MARAVKAKPITARDLIEKRRARWEELHDIDYDKRIVEAAARKILEDKAIAREIYEKPYLLIEIAFDIVSKDKETVPFFLNEVQRDFIERFEENGTEKPYFILKGRQQGFTSLITAIQLSYAIVRKNFSGMTIANTSDNALAIFNDKAKTVYARLPEILKPHEKFNSKRELFFDKSNSSWRIDTASEHVGRSRTPNFVHYSEVAFFECTLSGLQRSLGEASTRDAFVVYETTANGFNEAKSLWDSGACTNLFYEWWRTREYREKNLSHIAITETDAWISERVAFLRERGLDEEQISWYCRKYASYLDKDSIKQEYPCSPDEAFIATGKSVFDTEKITQQLMRCDGTRELCGVFEYKRTGVPFKTEGEVSDMEWTIKEIDFIERKDGYIKIHEEPMVKRDGQGNVTSRAPYAIGGDTAGTGQDYFTAKVISCLDGHTVATLRVQRIDEDLYAEQVYCLGKYYNDAIIGIEINYSRHPMDVLARVYSYPHVYYEERLDTKSGGVSRMPGFSTNHISKHRIIACLVQFMREHPTAECDPETLREMLTFIKKDNGNTEAVEGMHDDLVMALAIAHKVSEQGEHEWMRVETEEDRYLEEHFNISPRESGNEQYMSWEDL